MTPKLSLRYSPNDMKSYTDSERFMNTDNIFSNNRIGVDDTFEAGQSLTLGLNYKKERINNINKYFEMKLQQHLEMKRKQYSKNNNLK